MNDDTIPTILLLGQARVSEADDPIQEAAYRRVEDSLFRSARGLEGHSVSAQELVDWGYTKALKSDRSSIFGSRQDFIRYAVTCMRNDAADRARQRGRRVKEDGEEVAEGKDAPLLGELYTELEVYLADLELRSEELRQAVRIFWDCFWGGVRVIHEAVNDECFEFEIDCPAQIDETNYIEVAVRSGISRTVAYERFNLLKDRLKEHPKIGKAMMSRSGSSHE